MQKILDRKEANYKTIKEFGPVQSVQASDEDSQIEEDFIMLIANRNRAFNKGLSLEEVDREFMKPNKFYIKYILNADRKAKVLDDDKVYGDMKSVNRTLQEVKQDHFIEQQILTR